MLLPIARTFHHSLQFLEGSALRGSDLAGRPVATLVELPSDRDDQVRSLLGATPPEAASRTVHMLFRREKLLERRRRLADALSEQAKVKFDEVGTGCPAQKPTCELKRKSRCRTSTTRCPSIPTETGGQVALATRVCHFVVPLASCKGQHAKELGSR